MASTPKRTEAAAPVVGTDNPPDGVRGVKPVEVGSGQEQPSHNPTAAAVAIVENASGQQVPSHNPVSPAEAIAANATNPTADTRRPAVKGEDVEADRKKDLKAQAKASEEERKAAAESAKDLAEAEAERVEDEAPDRSASVVYIGHKDGTRPTGTITLIVPARDPDPKDDAPVHTDGETVVLPLGVPTSVSGRAAKFLAKHKLFEIEKA